MASESRAPEIRAKLLEWKRMTEAQRCSLRTLAAELGVSHQLLSFHLRHLVDRQRKEQREEYRRRSREIVERAETEHRPMTQYEQTQVEFYQRAALRGLLDVVLEKVTTRITSDIRKAFNDGNRSKALKLAKFLARLGSREGQEILNTHQKGRK